jgi:ABC-type glycerol-3-phosphate transport system permease component
MSRKRRLRSLSIGVNPQKFDRSQIKFYMYLVPICIFMGLPILFIFSNAFKPLDELFAYPPRFLVRRPTFVNFANLFRLTGNSNIPVSRYLFNSVIITCSVVLLTVFISVSAGYVLSKKKYKICKTLFHINTLALMFVPVAVSIPRYFIIINAGLYDNFFINILPLLCMPVSLFLVKQFIDQIPDSLIEAAVIDGASNYVILRKIIIPLTKPALSTVAILAFQSSWNSADASSLYISNESLKTFAFFMSTLSGSVGNSVAGQGVSAASSLVMFLPNLIFFIILQARVMNTMAHSGIK